MMLGPGAPSAEWLAAEEDKIKRLCIDQALELFAASPQLAMLYTPGELAAKLFLAIVSDLGGLSEPPQTRASLH